MTASLRNERQAPVAWAHDREMTMIERGDAPLAQALGEGHDRCVDEPEPQVFVPSAQFSDASVVPRLEIGDPYCADLVSTSRRLCDGCAGA